MNDLSVTCPNCNTTIPLTEQLAAPMIEATRQEFAARLATQKAEAGANLARESARLKQEAEDTARRASAAQIAERDEKLADLGKVLQQRNEKLAEAQAAQAAVVVERRELDDARRELALTVQKQVQSEVVTLREKARAEAEQALGLKLAEKEEQLAATQRKVEELHRRLEQGSQQLQGEVLELELESLLRQKFPLDAIEPVPKGEFGGDVLQRVFGPAGQNCGTLLWEAKRTKTWSDAWLSKLREDQRRAHAEIAVIVSHAVPKGLENFDHIEGIWVVHPKCTAAVALALRHSLIEISANRLASEGQQDKMEQVYHYLTGPRFRHRIEAIVEKFSAMQSDLDRERLTMQKIWAKREHQIRGVLEATVGMYGDLQGIAGKSVPEIEGLEPSLLE